MKVGDVVCLKGHMNEWGEVSWSMTITSISDFSSGEITCVWLNRTGELQKAEFPPQALAIVY